MNWKNMILKLFIKNVVEHTKCIVFRNYLH